MDSLDLVESRCTEKGCQHSAFRIGCTNCRLSNSKNIKYYFKNKLEDLKHQTVENKTHFKTICFNCSSSFHVSSYADGHFNLQKMFEAGEKCATCQSSSVTQNIANLAAALNINLVPTKMKICATCRIKIMKASRDEVETTEDTEVVDANIRMSLFEQLPASPSSSSSISTSSGAFIDKTNFINSLNKILPLIGVTPINMEQFRQSGKYRRGMFNKISSNLASRIFDVTPDSTITAEAEVGDENKMLDQLKIK